MKIFEVASKSLAEASPISWLLVGIGAWLALPAIKKSIAGSNTLKGESSSLTAGPPVGAALGGAVGAGVGGMVANSLGATIGAGLGGAVGASMADSNKGTNMM